MSDLRDMNLLVPEFREKAEILLTSLKNRGYDLRPCCTIRSPWEQARLWRSSRSREEISEFIENLKKNGAHVLVGYIESVGPQHGNKEVTKAAPGFSWHQFGEAMDCFVVRDGKARWSPDEEGYAVYASRAESLGLTAGRYFTSFPDNPHVQLRSSGSPRDLYFDIEIEARMVEIFGTDEKAWLAKVSV